MSETLKVGDIFPAKSREELKQEGIGFWEQRIATPLGLFLYDYDNQWRDGHTRWVSEDGTIRVTTRNSTNVITQVQTK